MLFHGDLLEGRDIYSVAMLVFQRVTHNSTATYQLHIEFLTPLRMSLTPGKPIYTAPENRPSYRELVFQPSFLKGYVKFRGCGSICGGPAVSRRIFSHEKLPGEGRQGLFGSLEHHLRVPWIMRALGGSNQCHRGTTWMSREGSWDQRAATLMYPVYEIHK